MSYVRGSSDTRAGLEHFVRTTYAEAQQAANQYGFVGLAIKQCLGYRRTTRTDLGREAGVTLQVFDRILMKGLHCEQGCMYCTAEAVARVLTVT